MEYQPGPSTGIVGTCGKQIGLIAIALVLLLTACSQGTARTGGTLVYGKLTEPAGLDPTVVTEFTAWQLFPLVYEQLVRIGDDLKPTPVLATSWQETSPTTYIFNIRQGVKFSNGREMTVDDVVGSLQRLTDPKTAALWATFVGKVTSVSAKGTSQVEVNLAEPHTAFIAALGGASASILPIKELRDGSFDPSKELLGTGPFMVASHQLNEAWNLKRNPHYWQSGLPKADALTVRIMPDDAARIAALRDGTIGMAEFENPDAVKLLEGQPNIKTHIIQTGDYWTIFVNSKTSIFKDPAVRQALSLAVDRGKIISTALAGTGKPSAAVPPSFGVCDASTLPYATPDLARASQLIDQAGVKGKAVSVIALGAAAPIAEVLVQNLKTIGINATIESPDEGTMIKRVFSGKAEFDLMVSFLSSYADASMSLSWWGSDQGWNQAWRVDDNDLASLVNQSRTDAAGPARDQAIKAACTDAAKDGYIITLVTKTVVVGYRSDKVTPELPNVDGYGYVLRGIEQYGAR